MSKKERDLAHHVLGNIYGYGRRYLLVSNTQFKLTTAMSVELAGGGFYAVLPQGWIHEVEDAEGNQCVV